MTPLDHFAPETQVVGAFDPAETAGVLMDEVIPVVGDFVARVSEVGVATDSEERPPALIRCRGPLVPGIPSARPALTPILNGRADPKSVSQE